MSPVDEILAATDEIRRQYEAACATTRRTISADTLVGFLEVCERLDNILRKQNNPRLPVAKF